MSSTAVNAPRPAATPRLRRAAFLAVALAALPCGCSSLRLLTGVGLERPSLVYESWSPEQLDGEGVTIALHYRLENPNGFSLDLRSLDYRLEVQEREVAEGSLPAGVTLRASGATPLSLPVRLRWRDVPGLLGLLVTRSEVRYRVTGRAGVGSALGTVALPFDHRDTLALPRLPALRVETGAARAPVPARG